ncbi:hypothetical protein Bca101_078202 [Brassica carinata]
MIFDFLFVFSVFVSATCRGEGATAAYKPNDVLLINCGATSDTNDTDNRTWRADEYYEVDLLPWNSENLSFAANASYQEDVAASHVPLMEARIFRSYFTYKFPVHPGWKFLRLYFYPTQYGSHFNANGSFFSVSVNSFTLLKNFSAYLTVTTSKPESKYLIKEFIVPVFETLSLSFAPSPNSLAFVNGVEIVSMPDGFYTKGGYDGEITSLSSTITTVDEATALETLYRLNVGGHMVSAVNDTGMFRRWLPDDDFFISEDSATKQILPDVKMDYTSSNPPYVAPEDVHKTYRTMGNSQNPQLNLRFNLTWLFKVDAGFTYLVRLHFCETLREVNEPDQRIFTIFIGNQIAKLEMNVISFTASPTPIYLDFSVYVGPENGLRPDLRLDLHPFKEVPPKSHDAILNGLEILKLNNLDSNPGPNSNVVTSGGESNVANSTRRKRIVTITLIAVGSVVLVVSVIVFLIFLVRQINRRKKKNRQNNSVAMFKVLLKHYTYAEVKKITKSFSHTIGKGGFGTVYGGNLYSNATSAYFPDWIYEDLENRQQTWILGDEITTEENEIARKMILVSLWCIQPCPMDRPPMNRVVEMIEGSLDALEIPPKPSMHISRGFVPDQSSSLPSFSHGYEAEEKNSNL